MFTVEHDEYSIPVNIVTGKCSHPDVTFDQDINYCKSCLCADNVYSKFNDISRNVEH